MKREVLRAKTPGISATPVPLPAGAGQMIAILMTAAFIMVLNETVMTVALPTLMVELDITASTAQWLTTAFLLTSAVVIPLTSFLLRRFTTRTLFIAAMFLFAAGTALASASPEVGSSVQVLGDSGVFTVLLVSRIIQAIGSAIMMPLLMTTILAMVPPSRRGSMMGLVTIVMSVAPAVGPTVSGMVLSAFDWRFLFLFVLPISAAALILGAIRMRSHAPTQPAALDVLSVLLSAVGFGGLVFGLSRLSQGPGDVSAGASLAVGALTLGFFVWRQITKRDTDLVLLDLRVFFVQTFTVSVVLIVAAMTALFGALIVLPLYLQQTLELDSFQTGLVLLPGGILMGVLSPVVGRLFDRFGPRPLVLPGIALTSGALWAMTTLNTSSPLPLIIAMHCALSIGFAFAFTPLTTSGLGNLPAKLQSHGTAILSTLQKVAGAAGTALFIAVLTIASRGSEAGATAIEASATGTHAAFFVGALLSVVSVLMAIFATFITWRRTTSERTPA